MCRQKSSCPRRGRNAVSCTQEVLFSFMICWCTLCWTVCFLPRSLLEEISGKEHDFGGTFTLFVVVDVIVVKFAKFVFVQHSLLPSKLRWLTHPLFLSVTVSDWRDNLFYANPALNLESSWPHDPPSLIAVLCLCRRRSLSINGQCFFRSEFKCPSSWSLTLSISRSLFSSCYSLSLLLTDKSRVQRKCLEEYSCLRRPSSSFAFFVGKLSWRTRKRRRLSIPSDSQCSRNQFWLRNVGKLHEGWEETSSQRCLQYLLLCHSWTGSQDNLLRNMKKIHGLHFAFTFNFGREYTNQFAVKVRRESICPKTTFSTCFKSWLYLLISCFIFTASCNRFRIWLYLSKQRFMYVVTVNPFTPIIHWH